MKKPIRIVKIGVKLLSMPAKPEDKPVSAYVNKKAGKKLPLNPTVPRSKNCLKVLIFRIARSANGKSTHPAISMRSAPTCLSEKIAEPSSANIPFFIKINELPQTAASPASINHAFNSFDIGQK